MPPNTLQHFFFHIEPPLKLYLSRDYSWNCYPIQATTIRLYIIKINTSPTSQGLDLLAPYSCPTGYYQYKSWKNESFSITWFIILFAIMVYPHGYPKEGPTWSTPELNSDLNNMTWHLPITETLQGTIFQITKKIPNLQLEGHAHHHHTAQSYQMAIVQASKSSTVHSLDMSELAILPMIICLV